MMKDADLYAVLRHIAAHNRFFLVAAFCVLYLAE